MQTHSAGQALQSELLARICSADPIPDDEFNQLALAVFAHQFARNLPYRAFCERRGIHPGRVARWTEIPAVPTDAFKAIPLVAGDPATARAVFRTSGTTQGRENRGAHHFLELGLYDASLRAGFRAALLADAARPRMLALVAPPTELPDSSLAHMVGEVMTGFGGAGSRWLLGAEGLDFDGLVQELRTAEREATPLCLLATTLAVVNALDRLEAAGEHYTLASGSRVMDTGGAKGRMRDVPRPELLTRVGAVFGIPPEWCINEYGMTEMSSQFYDGIAGQAPPEPNERAYMGPAWVRSRTVDPATLGPVTTGAVGVLQHCDLANLHSVMLIQTADLGVCDAQGRFRLLGRARGAEARGCSLAAEELLSTAEARAALGSLPTGGRDGAPRPGR